jgi:acyl-coenzyme A synthetase/AMP-(fatty) acid ligase
MSTSIPSAIPALSENNALIALISPYVPTQTLVIHNGHAISQQQFLNDLYTVVAQLPDAGFALNLCEDRYYFSLAFCALLLKGAVNLLPPNRQPATLIELAQAYPTCYCLFDKAQPCALPALYINELISQSNENLSPQNQPLPAIPAQQIAAIAFTSGSTGKPQANPKYWGTLAATARLLGQRLTMHLAAPTAIATVPSQHMYGLETTLMMALQAGVVMHSAKPFYPADVQALLQQITPPCILITAPVHLRAMVNAELPMPSLAGIISATAPLDPQVARASEYCFNTHLWEIYGCTEAGSMATRRSTQTDYWQLLDGFSLTITADCITAQAPHLNGSAPIQDQLEMNDKGEFLLSGRNTDMINVAGKRASLAHLTLQLLRIDGVMDGVIFLPPSSPTPQYEQRPVALVVSSLPEKKILTRLAEHIDAAFLPRPLRKVDALPRNETGKLTTAALNTLWSQFSDER